MRMSDHDTAIAAHITKTGVKKVEIGMSTMTMELNDGNVVYFSVLDSGQGECWLVAVLDKTDASDADHE